MVRFAYSFPMRTEWTSQAGGQERLGSKDMLSRRDSKVITTIPNNYVVAQLTKQKGNARCKLQT